MYEGFEDEELMALYLAGEERAFRELYGRYRGRVYGFILERVKDRVVTEELFQATFLKLHRFRSYYRKGELFSAWLFTICKNIIRDHIRKVRRTAVEVPLDEGEIEKVEAPSAAEKDDLLREVSAHLSERQRQALYLRYRGDMEFEEIAKILEISEVNVRQLISRALKKVKEKMAR